jgi:hypothetical protein
MVSELYSKQKLNTQNSDQDKLYDYRHKIDISQPIMEFSIMKLFIVNLVQLIKNKVSLSKHFYIAPSEIDRMYYWEYEYMLEEVNNNIKEENERNEKENGKYGNMNPHSMMRNAGRYMPKSNSSAPKIPSIGSHSLPSFHF